MSDWIRGLSATVVPDAATLLRQRPGLHQLLGAASDLEASQIRNADRGNRVHPGDKVMGAGSESGHRQGVDR